MILRNSSWLTWWLYYKMIKTLSMNCWNNVREWLRIGDFFVEPYITVSLTLKNTTFFKDFAYPVVHKISMGLK